MFGTCDSVKNSSEYWNMLAYDQHHSEPAEPVIECVLWLG